MKLLGRILVGVGVVAFVLLGLSVFPTPCRGCLCYCGVEVVLLPLMALSWAWSVRGTWALRVLPLIPGTWATSQALINQVLGHGRGPDFPWLFVEGRTAIAMGLCSTWFFVFLFVRRGRVKHGWRALFSFGPMPEESDADPSSPAGDPGA